MRKKREGKGGDTRGEHKSLEDNEGVQLNFPESFILLLCLLYIFAL